MLMGRDHVSALIAFTYPKKRKGSPQLIYYGKKYFQLKLVDI